MAWQVHYLFNQIAAVIMKVGTFTWLDWHDLLGITEISSKKEYKTSDLNNGKRRPIIQSTWALDMTIACRKLALEILNNQLYLFLRRVA